jgi:hypothetical protein
MRIRIAAVCAALVMAGIAEGAIGAPEAENSHDKLYAAIRANDLRRL